MHVLMIIPKIEPSSNNVLVGGSVNALVNLCNVLPEDVEVTVVGGGRADVNNLVPGFFAERISVKMISCRAPAQSIWFGAEFLIKTIGWALFRRSSKVDLVHGHSGYGVYAWVTWLVSKLKRCSSVHTLYCPVELNSRVLGRQSKALSPQWARRALNKMDAVIAMSGNIASSVCSIGVSPEKVRQVPSGVDMKRFATCAQPNAVKGRIGVPNDKRFILFVGNLTESKGVWDLLHAFRELATRDSDTYLVITLEISHSGFDSALERFQQTVQGSRIDDRVIRLGFVDFMSELLAAADCLVVPYRDTQGPSDYPLILMEAMSAGTPTIGTAVGGIPELLQDGRNGWLVSPESRGGLLQALEDLLENQEAAATRARNAKEYIKENFGPEQVRDEHMALYHKVIQGRSK